MLKNQDTFSRAKVEDGKITISPWIGNQRLSGNRGRKRERKLTEAYQESLAFNFQMKCDHYTRKMEK